MKYPKAAMPIIGIACITAIVWGVAAADQPNEDALRAFMRGKLGAAEDILEGLVTEDFGLIEEGSDQMKIMSQRAEWNVFTTPQYKQHSEEFRRAADRLTRAAKGEQLEAASLAYLQVTLACINCHKTMRGAKIADLRRLQPVIATSDDQLLAAGRELQQAFDCGRIGHSSEEIQ